MLQYNIHEKHIRKDSWVKDVRKTFNPEMLADLIKKRIEFPNSTGPFVRTTQDEDPIDIIHALIADTEECREKLTPAVGLLLWRMMHGKLNESHEILRGVFAIIRESRLIECRKLVYNWLNAKNSVLNEKNSASSDDSKWRNTYREGMMAYARIQGKDKGIEDWWFKIWREGSSVWWPAAFLGFRIQNPDAAAKELPLLISRNTDKSSYLLLGMWSDDDSRSHIELAIKNGLDDNTGWAGYALNMLLEKLGDSDKTLLMSNLNKLQLEIKE